MIHLIIIIEFNLKHEAIKTLLLYNNKNVQASTYFLVNIPCESKFRKVLPICLYVSP